ncbi:MAG TPA: universal stress protein, partial [Chloroflexota bacterium]|nr:universal stress protein [Chloroflexota bacterium]
MRSFRGVLFPFDGSGLAEAAVRHAVRLAQGARCPLILVQAVAADAERHQVRGALYALGQRVWRQGLGVETHVGVGAPPDVITEAVREWDAGAVVMSTHGRGGLTGMLYGSVAQQVVRHAGVPVILVPAGCTHQWPEPGDRRLRVLVALDGSEFAEHALHPALALARALSGDVTLTRAVDPTAFYDWHGVPAIPARLAQADPAEILEANARQYLEAVAKSEAAADADARVVTGIGQPLKVLVRLAHEHGVDAIVAA